MVHASDMSLNQKQELAKSLSREKEKLEKDLKAQDHGTLSSDRNEAQKRQRDEKKDKLLLLEAMKKESVLMRFTYRVQSVFLRVPVEEVFHNHLLANLRQELVRRQAGILGANGNISKNFIKVIELICQKQKLLHSVLRNLFEKKFALQNYFMHAFRELHQEELAVRDLKEIIDTEIFTEGLRSGDINLEERIKEARSLIKNYVLKIPANFLRVITLDLQILYFLYLLGDYRFKSFLVVFKGSGKVLNHLKQRDTSTRSELKRLLEDFYNFLVSISSAWGQHNDSNLKDLLHYAMINYKSEDFRYRPIKSRIPDVEKVYWVIVEIVQLFNSIHKESLIDFIRLASGNYHYVPNTRRRLEMPSFRKSFTSAVTGMMLICFEEFLGEVKEKYHSHVKERWLTEMDLTMLEYYSENSLVNPGKFQGMPGFAYAYHVNVVNNFINRYYESSVKPIYVFLIRSVLPKNLPMRATIISQSMEYENLKSRIKALEQELNPERTWGKSLNNILYRLEKHDSGKLAKQVETLLLEIDREAKLLLQQAAESFHGSLNLLNLILLSGHERLQAALGASFGGSEATMSEAIRDAIKAFTEICGLIKLDS